MDRVWLKGCRVRRGRRWRESGRETSATGFHEASGSAKRLEGERGPSGRAIHEFLPGQKQSLG